MLGGSGRVQEFACHLLIYFVGSISMCVCVGVMCVCGHIFNEKLLDMLTFRYLW